MGMSNPLTSRTAPSDDARTFVGTVHHVSFRVDDLDEALAFYEGILGCRRLPRPASLDSVPGIWLEAGSTQVHLIEAPADEDRGFPPKRIVPGCGHIAFHTDDLDAAEHSLRERGLEVERGKLLPQLFVQDPSGNLIEFTPF